MRVLFYRDCRALNRIQIAKATVEGTVVSDAYTVRALLQPPVGARYELVHQVFLRRRSELLAAVVKRQAPRFESRGLIIW